ncbi:NAP1-related protein 2 [Hibiscus trionum]|uniref:NAP1-related protein 2 n=1 Tax=Hibiscus trionum TaxID=183268 RepID=A0A9W7JGX7_HIBTR|nr:NAP1-related protein 2 [Hibiscus trionum]
MADKGKKSKLEEEVVEENAEQIDTAIEKLEEIQGELRKINEEASEKVLEVKQKYNDIRKPLYDKRNDIAKSIPDIWLKAFLGHGEFCGLLIGEDEEIFKHISSIEVVEDFKDLKSGYSISFNFNSNPYFEDTKLTKTFTFLYGSVKVTATKIKWKRDMGVASGADHKKKGNKRKFTVEMNSFFTWFLEAEKDDDGEEVVDEISEIIKNELWPNPLTYFNYVTSFSSEKFPDFCYKSVAQDHVLLTLLIAIGLDDFLDGWRW